VLAPFPDASLIANLALAAPSAGAIFLLAITDHRALQEVEGYKRGQLRCPR
jgi:hypothetical protein